MSQYILFLALGLGIGAVYAALAMGIVVTYQGTGVINFASAAMATVPLYVYLDLREGQVHLLIPWLPTFAIPDVSAWLAVVIALVVAAVLGVIVQLVVSKPLRSAPPLAKVVAAVGVMLTLQAALGLKYGTQTQSTVNVLPSGSITIDHADVGVDSLWLTALVIILGILLSTWFRRSRTGLAIRAASENERAASFAGLSPQWLGMVTWVLGSVFVAFIFIMAGTVMGELTPSNLTLLVVPALAGALIARLRSLWWALIGGLAVGVVQSELQFLSGAKTWWPSWGRQGLTDVVPFVVIAIVLFIAGRSIPSRGEDIRSNLPPVLIPRNRPPVIVALFVAGLVLIVLTSGSYRFGVVTSLAMALIALSLVVLTGMVGQISLAQAAFAGVAGLTLSKFGTGIPFPFSMLLAALIATVAGLFVGLPALRIRGTQLAVVTLAAAITLDNFVFGNPQILSPSANFIPNAHLFGINLAVRQGRDIARVDFGIFVLVVVAIAFVLVCNIMRAGSGRKMLAVRSNERAAASIGISVTGVKLGAFVLASFLAGLGGALIGYSEGQLSPDSFSTFVGLSFLVIAYIGGITSASGALVAGSMTTLGVVYVIFNQDLHLGNYYDLISGVAVLVAVAFNREGVAGKTRQNFDQMLAKRRGRDAFSGKVTSEKSLGADVEREETRVLHSPPSPTRSVGDVIFRTVDLSVSYGGVHALDGVSIEVRAGEIVGLIGPNGAGKTTFIDAATGFTSSRGKVFLGSESLSHLPAHIRARKGLVRTWQAVELFDDLSAENNIRVGDDIGKDGWKILTDSVRPSPPPSEAVRNAIALLRLEDITDRKPSELPLGRQKVLGVARVLASEPSVLLLDEPAAGLDTSESLHFGTHLREIAASGIGCLLVDHDMHLVLGVCDRIYVLDFGHQIACGRPEEVCWDPAVVRAYLGSQSLESDAIGAV